MRSRRALAVAVALGAVIAPATAVAAASVPAWMQRMLDDAPPEMEQMMREPEMQRMMRSPAMERMAESVPPRAMERMMRAPAMARMIDEMTSGGGMAGRESSRPGR